MGRTYGGALQCSLCDRGKARQEACRCAFWFIWSGRIRAACKVGVTLLYSAGPLTDVFRVLIQDHINKCMNNTQERIAWILALEDRPFSLGTHYLAHYRAKFLAYYKGAREQDRNRNLMSAIQSFTPPASSASTTRRQSFQETPPTGIAKVLAGLVELGFHGVKPEDLAKLIPPDGMEPALEIMADVRAYFQGTFLLFQCSKAPFESLTTLTSCLQTIHRQHSTCD